MISFGFKNTLFVYTIVFFESAIWNLYIYYLKFIIFIAVELESQTLPLLNQPRKQGVII